MDHIHRDDRLPRMTRHAEKRGRQRGVRTEVVDFVLANFDRDFDARVGATAVSISRRRLGELQSDRVPATVIDQAAHTVLIIGDDGAILTVINRPTWFARFHYGAERLNHRRRSRRRRQHSRKRR